MKHLRIATERRDALLNTGATGIIETDHRRAHFHGLVHDLADLFRMGFGKRPAEYGEVLTENENQPTVHGAVAGDDAIAGDHVCIHVEIRAPVLDEHVPFLEAVLVEQ